MRDEEYAVGRKIGLERVKRKNEPIICKLILDLNF
jgi:hypothetical protein